MADPGRHAEAGRPHGEGDITGAGLAGSSAQLLPAGSVLFSSRAPIGSASLRMRWLLTRLQVCVPYDPAMTGFIFTFLRYAGHGSTQKQLGRRSRRSPART